ncbi:pyridoxal-phosphate dependent enzyme [bacterium]|nr:pyridoxal-phosphate dependent enzyme [bacterium]
MSATAPPQSMPQTPDAAGYFGNYGGVFVPPELEQPLAEVRKAYEILSRSYDFIEELRRIRKHFQGRPTPTYHAARLSKKLGRTQIYLKREDLNHTGAHKLNHCMGEGLLAHYMGKKKLIAETGAGQHGVALATAAAYFGLECDIHMGEVDIAKQAPNVARMHTLGFRCYLLKDENGEPAPVHSIASGLDYPGVGPEHCHLKDSGRVQYVTAMDQDAVEAFYVLSRNEGIIPALESAHAVAHAMRLARQNPDLARTVLVNLSGRGDKDMDYMIEHYGTGGEFGI